MIYEIRAGSVVYVAVRPSAGGEPGESGIWCGKLVKQTKEELVLDAACVNGSPKIRDAIEAARRLDWPSFVQHAGGQAIIPLAWLATDTIPILSWPSTAASKMLPPPVA